MHIEIIKVSEKGLIIVVIIKIRFCVAAGVEFSEIEGCVSQDFQNTFPTYNLPRGNNIILKFARMSLMRAVHISVQTNFNISSTHPKTGSLALLSERSSSSCTWKWDKLITNVETVGKEELERLLQLNNNFQRYFKLSQIHSAKIDLINFFNRLSK